MYQPITPVTPFTPALTTVFCFFTYWFHCGTWPQSSRIASVFPSAIAWYTGTSAIFVILTLQPRDFSRTFLTTYVFAVDPAHACSFSVTVPHLADFAAALPAPSATTASAARTSPPTRIFIPPPFPCPTFSSFTTVLRSACASCPVSRDRAQFRARGSRAKRGRPVQTGSAGALGRRRSPTHRTRRARRSRPRREP